MVPFLFHFEFETRVLLRCLGPIARAGFELGIFLLPFPNALPADFAFLDDKCYFSETPKGVPSLGCLFFLSLTLLYCEF